MVNTKTQNALHLFILVLQRANPTEQGESVGLAALKT